MPCGRAGVRQGSLSTGHREDAARFPPGRKYGLQLRGPPWLSSISLVSAPPGAQCAPGPASGAGSPALTGGLPARTAGRRRRATRDTISPSAPRSPETLGLLTRTSGVTVNWRLGSCDQTRVSCGPRTARPPGGCQGSSARWLPVPTASPQELHQAPNRRHSIAGVAGQHHKSFPMVLGLMLSTDV